LTHVYLLVLLTERHDPEQMVHVLNVVQIHSILTEDFHLISSVNVIEDYLDSVDAKETLDNRSMNNAYVLEYISK